MKVESYFSMYQKRSGVFYNVVTEEYLDATAEISAKSKSKRQFFILCQIAWSLNILLWNYNNSLFCNSKCVKIPPTCLLNERYSPFNTHSLDLPRLERGQEGHVTHLLRGVPEGLGFVDMIRWCRWEAGERIKCIPRAMFEVLRPQLDSSTFWYYF